MKIIHGSSKIKTKIKRPVLTIGNFDGVHLGHQEIFKRVTTKTDKIHGTAVVYTFEPHPVRTVAPSASPKLLQTFKQKTSEIKACEIDLCIVEEFTQKFAKLSPEEFFEKIILKRIHPVHIVVGHDLTFGKHRLGTVELLEALCKKHGVGIDVVDAVFLHEILISSTQIRNFVAKGEVDMAGKLLGRPYAISGCVIKGRGIGKELGFHTANLDVENELVPLTGVYVTKTMDKFSVTNIGYNPTFGGTKISTETHILNFSQKLYGKKIEVMFYKRLRDEMTFENPSALKKQVNADIERAENFFQK